MSENQPTQEEILFNLTQALQNANALLGQLEQTDLVKLHRRRIGKLWSFYLKKRVAAAQKITWGEWLSDEANMAKFKAWLFNDEVDEELISLSNGEEGEKNQ